MDELHTITRVKNWCRQIDVIKFLTSVFIYYMIQMNGDFE